MFQPSCYRFFGGYLFCLLFIFGSTYSLDAQNSHLSQPDKSEILPTKTTFRSAENPLSAPPSNFRSVKNPLYWKNKKPYEGYWQQDVAYSIQASLNDSTEIIDGFLELTYYNNSHNALTEFYFHLYQNANQPGSLTDQLYQKNKIKTQYGKYESQNLGTEILQVKIDNQPISSNQINIDFTIMRIAFPQKLQPGDSCVFQIAFKTYFDRGSIRRRMKVFDHHGIKHFNGVHWYPRICVYDRKFSWETAQHLEKEFYGDFGTFNVQLTLPEHYIVEATGQLINEQQVLPPTLKQKLQISNFARKPINSAPSVIIPPSSKTKTWHYFAENVHDFAWTADPSYRIAEVNWNGIKCVAIAQENNAAGWQATAQFTSEVIALYSRNFGKYEYPKIVVADAADGMEYPMLTLCGGYYPSHRNLIAHEVGHNWFMGMVGSNETYRASLDEGFTQFLTAFALSKLKVSYFPEYYQVYAGYIYDAIDGKDMPLNTHSNEFNDAVGHDGGYGHVYFKTATMLYNLQYLLGDSVFMLAMKNYTQQWKMCHPYEEDFRNSIIMSAQTDLNTFFDQWLQSKAVVDYGIKKVRPLGNDQYKIQIKRHGNLVMPVHLDVIASQNHKNTKLLQYTIPSNNYRIPGRLHSKTWHSWNQLNTTFGLQVQLPPGYKIDQIWLDRSGMLADIDRRDNVWKKRSDWHFDWENGSDPNYLGGYHFLYRPALRYNQYSGWLLGAKLSGQYVKRKHVFDGRVFYAIQPNYNQNNFPQNSGLNSVSQSLGNPLAYSPIWMLPQRLSGWINWEHQVRNGGVYFADFTSMNRRLMVKSGWKMSVGNHTFGFYGKHMQGIQNAFNYTSYSAYFPGGMGTDSLANFLNNGGDLSDREIVNPANDLFIGYNNQHFNQREFNGIISEISRWNPQANTSLNLFWDVKYSGFGRTGSIQTSVRMLSPWSFSQYGWVNVTWKHHQPLYKSVIKSRVFAQIGAGNTLTPESVLYAAGANPEEEFENPIMRDFGQINIAPISWFESLPPIPTNSTQFLHYGGGLNLRGYQGRPLGLRGSNDSVYAFFRGTSGLSANLEWEFTEYWRKLSNALIWGRLSNRTRSKLPKILLHPYVFADAGVMIFNANEVNGSRIGNTNGGNSGSGSGSGTGNGTRIGGSSGSNSNRFLGGSIIHSGLIMDAGIGTLVEFKGFNNVISKRILNETRPLRFRFDMPLFLNTTVAGESSLQFRWLLGIERSF